MQTKPLEPGVEITSALAVDELEEVKARGFHAVVCHRIEGESEDFPDEAGFREKARQLGRTRLKKIRKDWKTTRKIMMTRAVYISARTNQAVYDALMQTADKQIIESSAYDYYWGCGRDRRGENQYGKVLMQVRAKLRQEQQAESSS